MDSSYEEHIEVVHRILRYLKLTLVKGLFCRRGEQRNIEAYTDVNWAGSLDDRKSTSESCIMVWGNLVTWRSKKQSIVAHNSAKAKLRALAQVHVNSFG